MKNLREAGVESLLLHSARSGLVPRSVEAATPSLALPHAASAVCSVWTEDLCGLPSQLTICHKLLLMGKRCEGRGEEMLPLVWRWKSDKRMLSLSILKQASCCWPI